MEILTGVGRHTTKSLLTLLNYQRQTQELTYLISMISQVLLNKKEMKKQSFKINIRTS